MFTTQQFIAAADHTAAIGSPVLRGGNAGSLAAGTLRPVAVCALLALGLPGISSAQALGTLQVTARVVPAPAAWAGVSEAALAAQDAVRAGAGSPLIRRSGLIRSAAEIRTVGDRRVVLVTIHHPHN